MGKENILRALSLVKSRGTSCMKYLSYKHNHCSSDCCFSNICISGFSSDYCMNLRYHTAIDIIQNSDQTVIFDELL